jgi:histidinol dehydrogenase
MLVRVIHGTPGYADAIAALRDRGEADFSKVEGDVRAILEAVKKEGDDAVLRFISTFEKRTPKELVSTSLDELRCSRRARSTRWTRA